MGYRNSSTSYNRCLIITNNVKTVLLTASKKPQGSFKVASEIAARVYYKFPLYILLYTRARHPP